MAWKNCNEDRLEVFISSLGREGEYSPISCSDIDPYVLSKLNHSDDES